MIKDDSAIPVGRPAGYSKPAVLALLTTGDVTRDLNASYDDYIVLLLTTLDDSPVPVGQPAGCSKPSVLCLQAAIKAVCNGVAGLDKGILKHLHVSPVPGTKVRATVLAETPTKSAQEAAEQQQQ